jgi:hypothetical protein
MDDFIAVWIRTDETVIEERWSSMVCRILLVLFFVIAPGVTDAVACSCIQVGDALAAVPETDAVFRARALTSMMVLVNDDGTIVYKTGRQSPTGFVRRLVVLRIEELFKGAVAPLIVLVTGSGGGDCGYVFEDGKEYLVFAEMTSDKRMKTVVSSSEVLTTSICTFTQPAAGATALLDALRKKFPPKEPAWVSWPE